LSFNWIFNFRYFAIILANFGLENGFKYFGLMNRNARKKNRLIFYILIQLFLPIMFTGCDLTYKVRNQHNAIEETIHVPCGKVTFELVGRGNSKFVFNQKVDPDESIIVFPDSLKIFYNDYELNVDHNIKNGNKFQGGVEIKGKKSIETSFQIQKGVFEGDTIKVVGVNYLKCSDQLINLDTVTFAFINNLRIFGVNEF